MITLKWKLLLKQEVFSFLAKFYFYIDGAVVAEMERKLSLFRPNYYIKGLDWECKGDFWAHNYQIVHDGEIIATIKKNGYPGVISIPLM